MGTLTDLQKYQHFSWRAGFGASPADLASNPAFHAGTMVRRVLREARTPVQAIRSPETENLQKKFGVPGGRRLLAAADRKALIRMSLKGILQLNLAWLDEISGTGNALREKMSLFWHGHFACRTINILHAQQLLQIIRENALGNFGDLLISVSKSAAMLQFLNNQQNRKQHPNENFAREVMELFTMGRGNYTEQDVKEGARAFTGWGFEPGGQFRLRPFLHDDGMKTFLGRTGRFDGDDILHILLEHRATSRHLAAKLYAFLVNDRPDPDRINWLGERFYGSGYDIASLLRDLFHSDWFYNPEHIGARIKSPVELMAGMRRTIPVTLGQERYWMVFQRLLDQVLFFPPNVGGWPGGRDWIDSSTLMTRLRLPQILYQDGTVDLQPKELPEMTEERMMEAAHPASEESTFERAISRRVGARADWEAFLSSFGPAPEAELPQRIADALLVNIPSRVNRKELDGYADLRSRELYLKSLTIDLMSLPEYQLC